MRYLLISAAAALAVGGATMIASAQDDKEKGPAAEGKKSPGAARQGPGAGKSEHPKQQPKSEAPKGAQREPGSQQPKGAQSQQRPAKDERKSTQQRQDPGKDQPKAAQQPQPGKDQPQSTPQRQEPGKDQPKAAQQPQPGKDKQKSTQQQQDPGKDQPKAAQQQPQPGKDQPGSAQQQGTDKASGRVQVSEEQRTNFRERLVKETRVERTRINVSVNVGTTIPRSVRLHTLPVGIVVIAPAYREYNYILLEDETIVIVDPRTYVIVDVIAVDTQRADRPGRAHLTLNLEERRFIFTTVPRDRTADVRVRLALGAEVPRDVELLTFPSVVTARVPEVQRYRYIVSGDDIVIVDPSDNDVVLVISE